MLNGIRAVIFDLDGTLVDSMSVWHDIDVAYFAEKELEMPANIQESIEGMSMIQTALYFKEHFNIEDSVEEIMASWNEMAYDRYRYEIELKDGVEEFLEYLENEGIRMAIATSNSKYLCEAVLYHHGVLPYFDCVISGDEVENGKPAPDIYLEAAEKLGIEPEECLVIEDIPAGILAGVNADMRVCAIEDSYSEALVDVKKDFADYYVESYADILNGNYEALS